MKTNQSLSVVGYFCRNNGHPIALTPAVCRQVENYHRVWQYILFVVFNSAAFMAAAAFASYLDELAPHIGTVLLLATIAGSLFSAWRLLKATYKVYGFSKNHVQHGVDIAAVEDFMLARKKFYKQFRRWPELVDKDCVAEKLTMAARRIRQFEYSSQGDGGDKAKAKFWAMYRAAKPLFPLNEPAEFAAVAENEISSRQGCLKFRRPGKLHTGGQNAQAFLFSPVQIVEDSPKQKRPLA